MSAASPKTSPQSSSQFDCALPLDSRLAFDEEINFIAKITARENAFPCLKMLPVHRLIRERAGAG